MMKLLVVASFLCVACQSSDPAIGPGRPVEVNRVFGLKGGMIAAYPDEASEDQMDMRYAYYVKDEKFRLRYLEAFHNHEGSCQGIRLRVSGTLTEMKPSSDLMPVLLDISVQEILKSEVPGYRDCDFRLSQFE